MSFYLRFDLFERSTSNESNCQNFEQLNISCTHFGRSNLWIGDKEGFVYKYDKDFGSAMFIAYKTRVIHIYQCRDKDILITCGLDSTGPDVIKIWDFSKWNKQNIPTIIRTITSTDLDFKVVCFNVLNNLNAMVLALGNRQIDLIYTDVLNQKKSKRKQIHTVTEDITTVAINENNDLLYVFLTTINKIVILAFNEQTNEIKVTLDVEEGNCPEKCSVLMDNIFVVANQKGIYEVYQDYVGPCRAMDGVNISLHLFKHYLILVKLVKPSVLAGTHLMQRSSSALNYQIVIFDHVNRFIACEFPLQDFNFLFIEWGSIFVYCGPPTNRIYVFTEKDIQQKLNIFFQKNSFKLAIDIARSQNYDADALADMFHKYGDHLYNMKNYDEAIQQYIKTIGKLEPSFVIHKFMKTPLISNLVKYMEVLVKEDNCTAEHNALLLNCYIILKDQNNLMDFIQTHKAMKFENCDIDKSLNLLRKVDLRTEALALAKKYDKHDWYLKILIEDEKKFKEAIQYISLLPLKETEKALLDYGNKLISEEPEIFAKQLETVCNKQTDSNLNIATILNVFVNNRKGLKHFLKKYISKIISNDDNYSIYVDTLIELLLYEVQKEKSDQSAEEVMNILQNENLQYHKSKALICCQMRGFMKGYRYLCELQQNYLEILNSYKSENNVEGIMETCRRFGSRDNSLWIHALEYLIEVNASEKYFGDIIHEIEEYGLISPLLLLEKMTMSSYSFQFGLVKDFVLRYYEKNEKLIKDYQNEITKLQEETKKNNETILCLNKEVQVFQNLKCMMCQNILDIPSVHFLCNHSYHLKCFEMFNDSKDKCPNCAPKTDEMLSEINQWKSSKLQSLADVDGFSLEHLWRNVLTSSSHPMTIDPDQLLADVMVKSMLSSDSFPGLRTQSMNDSKNSKTSDISVFKEPISVPVKEIPTPLTNLATAEIKINNVKKIYSAEKLPNPSPDRSSPILKKGSPQILSKEKFSEPKRSNLISKNPFEAGNFKASSSKKEYPDNLNPFE